MTAVATSIRVHLVPPVQYVLRIADTCLESAHRQTGNRSVRQARQTVLTAM